jgi:hypothetical protein
MSGRGRGDDSVGVLLASNKLLEGKDERRTILTASPSSYSFFRRSVELDDG